MLNVQTLSPRLPDTPPTTDSTIRLSRRLLRMALDVYRNWVDGEHGFAAIEQRLEFINQGFFRDLAAAVCELQVVNLSTLEKDAEKIAFWANVHNILEIHAQFTVGCIFPVHRQVYLCTSCYLVGGHVFSLDAIVNGILRGNRRAPTFAALAPGAVHGDASQATAPHRVQFDGDAPPSAALPAYSAAGRLPPDRSLSESGREAPARPPSPPPALRHRIFKPFPPGDPRRALAVKEPDPRVHFALLDLTSDELPNFLEFDGGDGGDAGESPRPQAAATAEHWTPPALRQAPPPGALAARRSH
eukprot:gene8698-7913_t